VRTLGLGQGMGRWRAHGLRPAITADKAIGGLPALKGAQIDARIAQAGLSRAPARCATSMSRANAWRSSRPIIRPLLG